MKIQLNPPFSLPQDLIDLVGLELAWYFHIEVFSTLDREADNLSNELHLEEEENIMT